MEMTKNNAKNQCILRHFAVKGLDTCVAFAAANAESHELPIYIH
jgi:hypothetical protein